MQDSEMPLLSARPPAWGSSEGVPLAVLAGFALFASCLGRLLAPALFGAGTGLEHWIMVTQAAADLLIHAVAAGGGAFALRAVGLTLGRRTLGIGYRLVVI